MVAEKPGSSEHDLLKADVLKALSAMEGVMVWNHPTGMGQVYKTDRYIQFGLKGSGDIIGAAFGRPISVEVKTGGGKQKAQQKKFQTAYEKAGGVYIVARSVEGVTDEINRLHKEPMNERLHRERDLFDARQQNAGPHARPVATG